MDQPASKPPIINCHTHIFTERHVPPYIARSFVPPPLHFLLGLPFILRVLKILDKWKDFIWYSDTGKRLRRLQDLIRNAPLPNLLYRLLGAWITLQVLFILYDWVSLLVTPNELVAGYVETGREELINFRLLLRSTPLAIKWLLVIILLAFIKVGRNFIFFVFRNIWSFFKLLPGSMTKGLIQRYLLLAKFSTYQKQSRIFDNLQDQYPAGTGFVVLPMDMDYMGAGKVRGEGAYRQQMQELKELLKREAGKETFFPFFFVDPRRAREEGSRFFDFTPQNGQVILHDCMLKEYMDGPQAFSGFKIYPALGYYPFEEELLPIWKFAADRGLPILTHCTKGSIFYRGPKKKEWKRHPVFQQKTPGDRLESLFLAPTTPSEFSLNFTHPLNYLCLLDEYHLRQVVGAAKDDRIRELFGYSDPETTLEYNLSHLKLCFGHFGGEDQWKKFLESDRWSYSQRLITHPDEGINFFFNQKGERSPDKLAQIWKFVDWYSIICSIMLQYPNVYSDISYILHDPEIFPLLQRTVSGDYPKLRKRVLYGTDFYVVRNHKSDKQMVVDTAAWLPETEFDQIARINPREFLNLTGK